MNRPIPVLCDHGCRCGLMERPELRAPVYLNCCRSFCACTVFPLDRRTYCRFPCPSSNQLRVKNFGSKHSKAGCDRKGQDNSEHPMAGMSQSPTSPTATASGEVKLRNPRQELKGPAHKCPRLRKHLQRHEGRRTRSSASKSCTTIDMNRKDPDLAERQRQQR